MIISKEVIVRINASNINHYKNINENIKCGDYISVNIKDLTRFSNCKISVKCDDCGIEKEISYKNYSSYKYSNDEYLCRKCKTRRNNLKKYGVENVFQLDTTKNKIKETILEKYGVENISQSDFIKNKVKESNLKKYGVDHPLKNKDILEKQKSTNIKRYGVDNVSKLEYVKDKKTETTNYNYDVDYIFFDNEFKKRLKENNLNKYGVENILSSNIIKNKIKITNLKKYGFDNPSKNALIKNKIKKNVIEALHRNILLNNVNIISINSDDRTFKIHCDLCNKDYIIGYFLYYKRRETNTCICTNCNKIDKHQSGLEIQLQNFIKDKYMDKIIYNYRLNGKELDIYLPKLNLAFEFNGIYWHSEIFKEKNYHKIKTDMCNENGIELIHIWEDDWKYKSNIVKSMIINKFKLNDSKIYARSCYIKEINDIDILKKFLTENHIQGYASSSVKIGLYKNDILVSLMCFKKNKNGYELNRFCNLCYTTVVGSGSKLLNYFIKNYSSEITTFSNNSYSNGKIYEKLGFDKLYDISPDYHYVVSGIRIHKFNFRNNIKNDMYKIYDAGKIKYKYNNDINKRNRN